MRTHAFFEAAGDKIDFVDQPRAVLIVDQRRAGCRRRSDLALGNEFFDDRRQFGGAHALSAVVVGEVRELAV